MKFFKPVTLCLVLAGLFTACSAARANDVGTLGYARVCFIRHKDNGIAATLVGWAHVMVRKVPLSSGQTVCLPVKSGSVEVFFSSISPGDATAADDEACASEHLQLELKIGDKKSFTVAPIFAHGVSVCGWDLSAKPD